MSFSNLEDFNREFFKKLDFDNLDHEIYVNECIEKYKISDYQEVRAIIIYYYWNFYFDKLFSNLINKKNKKDPRTSVLFRYCYKLQRDTLGILIEQEYKDYVFCQLKSLKNYIEKTGNIIQVTPNILNFDKGYKRWKYFKFKLNKIKYTNKTLPNVNTDVLRSFLIKDRKFLESKIIINKKIIKDNLEKLLLWNRIGNLSIYFLAFNNHLLKDYKDLSVYRFDDKGKKIFLSIFPELI
jgi:hypothetical protein